MEITKGKWFASHTTDNSTTILCHDKKDVLCTIKWSGRRTPKGEQKANAERIVKAVNSYDAMKKALKELLNGEVRTQARLKVIEALANAE